LYLHKCRKEREKKSSKNSCTFTGLGSRVDEARQALTRGIASDREYPVSVAGARAESGTRVSTNIRTISVICFARIRSYNRVRTNPKKRKKLPSQNPVVRERAYPKKHSHAVSLPETNLAFELQEHVRTPGPSYLQISEQPPLFPSWHGSTANEIFKKLKLTPVVC
jgi:hypothetical protein